MTDALSGLWLATLQEIVGLAAHEVKNPLNGLSVNMEVVRSRVAAGKTDPAALSPFADAAYQQLAMLIHRTESLLRLGRGHRSAEGPANIAQTLVDLGNLLGPVLQGKGGQLELTGMGTGAPLLTSAEPMAVRLALAVALLALIKEGGVARVQVEAGPELVVRFSHESAAVGDIDPAIAAALGPSIRARRSDKDLHIVFPGHS